mgnify:FL=1
MSNNRFLTALTFCFFCFVFKATAQFSQIDSCGVYQTFQDYQRQHFAYPVPVHRNGHTIWPQGFFVNKDIV